MPVLPEQKACLMYSSWNDLIISMLVPSYPDNFLLFVYFALYIFRGLLFDIVHALCTFIQLCIVHLALICYCLMSFSLLYLCHWERPVFSTFRTLN